MNSSRGKLWLIEAGGVLIVVEVLLAPAVGLERAANSLGVLLEVLTAAIACYCCAWRGKCVNGRERTYWRLWALGFALRIVGEFLAALSRIPASPTPIEPAAMGFSFVPLVPGAAALILQPELGEAELRDP